MQGDPYRGTKKTRPSGWGLFTKDGALLFFHNSEKAVREWAEDRDDEAEVRKL